MRSAFLLLLAACLLVGCARQEPEVTPEDRAEEARADSLAQMYGKNHELVATSLSAKALDYSNRGMHSQAERLYRRIVRVQEAEGGIGNPRLAATLLTLGIECEKQQRYMEAEAEYRRALLIREKDDSAPAERAEAMQFLADAQAAQKKYAAAEATYRQRVAVCESGCPAGDLARGLRDLALFLQKQKRESEAAALLRRSDDLFRAVK